jgi:small subunit ribosomal protein S4e
VLLRNRLKYALTGRETKLIVMQRIVKVDQKVRTDVKFPVGFQDVLSIDRSNEHFRMLYDVKGRFQLHAITPEESSFKLCKLKRIQVGAKGIPVANTTDSRTIRFPDPSVSANDTVKVDVRTNKIVGFHKFDVGNVCTIIGGRNIGRVGIIQSREKHMGSYEIVHVKDKTGSSWATRLSNVFVIGTGDKPDISLPKSKGIKISIVEERARVEAKAKKN